MAYNYYSGNRGRAERIEEKTGQPRPAPPQGAAPREDGGLTQALSKLLPTNLRPTKLGELETEDLILLLILYLMYRESGDSELLMIMGAMFLL